MIFNVGAESGGSWNPALNELGAKNILKNNTTSQTVNGVTFTVNEDGSVTANGTASNTTWLALYRSAIPMGNYILSGCPNGGGDNTYRMQLRKYSDSTDVTAKDTGNGSRFEIEDSTIEYVVHIGVSKGRTVNNLTFYPMIRYASITDDTYEPYSMTNKELTDSLGGLSFGYDSASGKYGYWTKEAGTDVFVPFKSGGLIEAELPFRHADIDCLAREYVTTTYRIDLTEVSTITFNASGGTTGNYDLTYGLCESVPTSSSQFENSKTVGVNNTSKSVTYDVSAYSGYYYLCFYYYIGTGAYHAYVKDLIFA